MSKQQITNFFSPASKPGRSDGNDEQTANIATRQQANCAFRNTSNAKPFVVMVANLHFRM